MTIQNSKLKIKNYKSKFKTFNFLVVLLTFNFLLLTVATKVANGQSLSLGIYPPLLEVMIQPGKSITQVYEVINEGESDLVMTSKIVPFEPSDEMGNIVIRDTKNEIRETQEENSSHVSRLTSHPLGWFSFQNADLALGQNFLLKAGSQQQIVLRIDIPPQAKEDDYYLTLLFETTPGVDLYLQPGSVSSAQAKIGSNILLTVSETGEPPRKAEIEEFKIGNWKLEIGNLIFIDSFTKPQFILRVKNTGRSFFKPMGTITTTGWPASPAGGLGQKYLLDLLPENVLTGSIRQIQCQTADKVAPCQCELNSKFLLGPYQAKVEFGLDKVSQDVSAQLNFIALPLRLILALLVALILIIIVKLARRRHQFNT